MRTLLTAATLVALSTAATAEPVKLTDTQLGAVTAGWLVFQPLEPIVFEPFEPMESSPGVFSFTINGETTTGVGGIAAALEAFFAAF